MRQQARYHFYPVDWIIIGYSCVMALLILAIGRPLSEYINEIAFYSAMALIAWLIVRFVPENGTWMFRFVRLLYPGVMFTLFYRITGGTMFLVFDKFLDPQLTGFEQAIFGFEPSLWLDRNLLNVWLNEIFMGCYFSYYFMLPGLLITLFILKRDLVLRKAQAAIALTFFVSYFLFFLYPIEGPRWHFIDNYLHRIDGPLFSQLVNFMIANGAVRGGCMPSTHVAVALVIMIFARRENPIWGKVMLPIVIGLAIGTAWGRYHYISDAFVGAAIALAATWLVLKYHHQFEPTAEPHHTPTQEKVPNVS